jgi:hypothetical protein
MPGGATRILRTGGNSNGKESSEIDGSAPHKTNPDCPLKTLQGMRGISLRLCAFA